MRRTLEEHVQHQQKDMSELQVQGPRPFLSASSDSLDAPFTTFPIVEKLNVIV